MSHFAIGVAVPYKTKTMKILMSSDYEEIKTHLDNLSYSEAQDILLKKYGMNDEDSIEVLRTILN